MKVMAKKNILLISSQVVRGSVGSRAAQFVFETMGFGVWSLLTVSLTWHPGQGRAHRLIVSEQDFSSFCRDIATSPHAREIDGVITGYFAVQSQVHLAAELIKKLKNSNPHLTYLCDPVMADEGGLYIDSTIASAIRDELLPLADIIKPNRSELEWIFATRCSSREDIMRVAMQLPTPILVVSSAPAIKAGATGNLLIKKSEGRSEVWLAEHPLVANPVNGLGDLTASLFLSHYLQNEALDSALDKTTAAVFDCLSYAVNHKADELLLARSFHHFLQPESAITLTRLG